MDYYYPDIDIQALLLMIELQKQDPDYIRGSDYGPEIEGLFLGLTEGSGVGAGAGLAGLPMSTEGMSKWDRLEYESNELFEALTQAGKGLAARDNAEKMAYFRVAASLLEKIVAIQERALNLKKLATFQQIVLSVMDDVLTGDQRLQVRARLEEAARGE
jgi:hypothetical protein